MRLSRKQLFKITTHESRFLESLSQIDELPVIQNIDDVPALKFALFIQRPGNLEERYMKKKTWYIDERNAEKRHWLASSKLNYDQDS